MNSHRKVLILAFSLLIALCVLPSTALAEGENQAPAVTVPVTIDVPVGSLSPLTGISFSDPDAGSGTVTVTFSVSSGTLSATDSAGVSVLDSGTGSLTLTGSILDINAFIAASKVTYLTATEAGSTVMMTVLIDDNGNTGTGGTLTDTETVAISVQPFFDSNDFTKMQAFLEQPSAVAGKTNGQQINGAYDRNNPATWTGVVWNTALPKRVATIGLSNRWWNKFLAGSLDLSGFTSLTELECGANQISALNVNGDTALKSVKCFSNKLTTLDLSTNTALTDIHSSTNLLTSINVNGAASLTSLNLIGNKLTELDVSGAAALTRLECSGNLLSTLDVSANAALKYLICGGNPFTSLDVSANTALVELNCYYGALTSLNVRGLSALSILTAADNALTAIDVSTNTALTGLYLWDNQLTTLDVTQNTALIDLYCEHNKLTELDLSQNSALYYLYANDNQISALDISGCAMLANLYCKNNRLTSLDASASTDVFVIQCQGNAFTSIRASIKGGNVFLVANGNGSVQLEYLSGTRYYAQANPHTGFGFGGWTSPVNPESANARYDMVRSSSYDLTANFTYTATFDKNGGGTNADPVSRAVVAGTLIPAPSALPTRAGYVFGGWYKEPDCVNVWNLAVDTVAADVTLYAKWTAAPSALVTVPSAPVIITELPQIYTMYEGARVTWNPQPSSGTWDWDESYFSASFNSPATFTALKAGTSKITYTVKGASQSVTVTVREAELPQTGQDYALVHVLLGLSLFALAAGIALKKTRHTL